MPTIISPDFGSDYDMPPMQDGYEDFQDDGFQDFSDPSEGCGMQNDFSGRSSAPSSASAPIRAAFIVSSPADTQNGAITDILINYNEKYQKAQPALYRDEQIAQTMAVLISKSKPNPLLVGPAGCGKTRIVEEIARLIANDDPSVPDRLCQYTIYELPISALVSGSSLVGDIEKKLTDLIEFFRDENNRAICFIDEIHLLKSADPSYSKISQLLKPALARGDLHLIGATTTQEYQELEKDPAFNRRFCRILVEELTREQTITIADHFCTVLTDHYCQNQQIFACTRNLIEYLVQVADDYHICSLHRPDNALTLLDRTVAEVIVIKKPEIGHPIFISQQDVDNTAARIMSRSNTSFKSRLPRLRQSLQAIRGQDQALDTICEAVENFYSGCFENRKPLSLLLSGISGCGKTETAKQMSRFLFNQKPIVLNMTEYQSPADLNRLMGAPAGYIGFDSHQELPFDALFANPYQVILLDEFEKCHPLVQQLFMRILDEGIITSNRGKDYDFSKAVILATTNAGHDGTQSRQSGLIRLDSKSCQLHQLQDHFDTALLNRFEAIIDFQPIHPNIYDEILTSLYRQYAAECSQRTGRTLEADLSPEDMKRLQSSYVPEFGARPALKAVQSLILEKVRQREDKA